MSDRLRTTAGALAAVSLILAGCGTSPADDNPDSGAGCYGPWLDNDSSGEPPDSLPAAPGVTVSPGETVKIYGHGYTSTCNDTGDRSELEPLGSVNLTVTLPDGMRIQLGEFIPRVEKDDVGFVANVTVPAGAAAGTAVVSDTRSPAATYRIAIKK